MQTTARVNECKVVFFFLSLNVINEINRIRITHGHTEENILNRSTEPYKYPSLERGHADWDGLEYGDPPIGVAILATNHACHGKENQGHGSCSPLQPYIMRCFLIGKIVNQRGSWEVRRSMRL
jgi:hypothetical protein